MRRTQMKRIISIILCVALLACVSQLFASVDIMAATRSGDLSSAETVDATVDPDLANLGEDFYAKISYTGYNSVVKNIAVETSNGNNVAVYAEDYTSKQLWHFIRQSDGSYKIASISNNGLCLSVVTQDGEQYGNVKLADDDGSSSQRWRLYSHGSQYGFVPASREDAALDVDNGNQSSFTDGTNLHLWQNNAGGTQLFDIAIIMTLTDLGEDFYAKLSYTGANTGNNETNLVKNVFVDTANDNNVVVYSESNITGDNITKKLWRFIRQSDGSYKIANMYSGLYLYAYGKEGEPYGEVKVSADDGTQSVRWKIYLYGSKYTFVPVSSPNIALDVDKGTTQLSDGTTVHLWENNYANLTQAFDITNMITLADPGKDFYAKISYISENSSTELHLSLDINNADDPDNAAVYKESTIIGEGGVIGEYNNTKQLWRFVRQSDGSYIISNMYNGKYLTVAGKSSDYNVTILAEETADISRVCRWRLYQTNGKYVFKPDCSYQSVMDIAYGGDTDGTNAQAWYYNETGSQKFSVNKIMEIADIGDDFYANVSFVNGENSVNLIAHGDNAVVYEKIGTTLQNWRFIRQSDGGYKIVNMYYGYGNCLSVKDSSAESGADVRVYEDSGLSSQVWYIYHKDGKFVFKSGCSPGTALDVGDGSTANETNVWMYVYNGSIAQSFEINKIMTPANPGDDFYAYLNIDKKNLDYDSNNSVTATTINTKSEQQKWHFVRQTSGDYIGSYEITNCSNAKCIDVSGAAAAAGTDVFVYDDNDTSAQRWYIFSQSGKYVLRAACAPNNALTLNSSTNDIYMDTYVGDMSQTFAIQKLTATSDIQTVTSDNIKFQLFNYNENINRKGGVKAADGTDNW